MAQATPPWPSEISVLEAGETVIVRRDIELDVVAEHRVVAEAGPNIRAGESVVPRLIRRDRIAVIIDQRRDGDDRQRIVVDIGRALQQHAERNL